MQKANQSLAKFKTNQAIKLTKKFKRTHSKNLKCILQETDMYKNNPIKTNQTWNQRSNLFMTKQLHFAW